MSRATRLLLRAWDMLGRGPFMVAPRAITPRNVPDDYELFTVGGADAAPVRLEGEQLLGEVPLLMNVRTRGPQC